MRLINDPLFQEAYLHIVKATNVPGTYSTEILRINMAYIVVMAHFALRTRTYITTRDLDSNIPKSWRDTALLAGDSMAVLKKTQYKGIVFARGEKYAGYLEGEMLPDLQTELGKLEKAATALREWHKGDPRSNEIVNSIDAALFSARLALNLRKFTS
jgi:hypothetical protein